ncbi:Alpha/beta hydrolase family-domain-containing protein [Xylariaceae sp. FL0255]|nr:Alpha/beta hydrolase family-domain-containing protein [Xylariaceae sp. FL0255]
MSSSFPFHIKEHTVPGQHIREWPRATSRSQEDILQLHVKQYTPKDNPDPQPGDITILGAHANGFPKELYEALWADLHAQSVGPKSRFRIRAIWVADISNQGYSGQLNEDILGDDPCWHDLSRDLLHLTNIFRAEMPRPIIGVGHSFGANILTNLALIHPRLMTTMVLLDPTIISFRAESSSGPGVDPARLSAFRRDLWPSRDAATESFRRSPFYCSWDPRVLEAWIEHAVRDLPTPLYPDYESGGATLRTTKHQELYTFYRPLWPHLENSSKVSKAAAPDFDPSLLSSLKPGQLPFSFYRSEGATVLRRLPEVRPSVLFVFGGTSDLSIPELRELRMSTCGIGPGGSGGVAEGRVKGIVVEGKGHLFPMEVPQLCADHAASWIGSEMDRWRDEQKAYEAWVSLPMRHKTTMSQEFLERVGRPKKTTQPKL